MPSWTLESLAFHWGDAYLFSYTRDRWVALRRDNHSFITADTLAELEAAIEADYAKQSVPRTFDPPGTDDYLGQPEDEDENPDSEASLVLSELRQLFPLWEVTYSAELGTWIAKSKHGAFCEHFIALVWVALERIGQKRIDWD